jgi:hypothetical protein
LRDRRPRRTRLRRRLAGKNGRRVRLRSPALRGLPVSP